MRRQVLLFLATVLTLGGCASATESSSPGSSGGDDQLFSAEQVSEAQDAALEAAGGSEIGGSLTLSGVLSGEEGQDFEAVLKPFSDATGVQINYSASQDQNATVQAQVEAGNPPDLVDGVGSGAMLDYAQQGLLLDVGSVVGRDVLADGFNSGLLDSVTSDGKIYGIWSEVDDFMVWYNAKTYDGPTDPTWDELTDWAQSKAKTGQAPWCMALEAGSASGFPAQPFIENIFLKTYGAQKLTAWANGDLSWSSPEVKQAFEEFGAIAGSDEMVNGGPQAVISTGIANYGSGLFSDPQQCSLMLWGNYAAGLVQGEYPEVKVPDDLSFFPVPPTDNAEAAQAQNIAGHVMYAFNDTPQVRAFLKYWASAQAQTLIAATGRWTVDQQGVPEDAYPNAAMRQAAELLNQPDAELVPGPSAVAPAAVTSAWQKAIIGYLQDPSSLDEQLASIDAAADA